MKLADHGGPRERVVLLDEVRGVCILLMVAYHAAYDLVYIFGVDISLFHQAVLRRFAQPFVAGLFIFTAGICCRFSRSNTRRGLAALSVGLAMGLFTVLFMPEQAIYFGILHFMGCAMLLFGPARRILDRLNVPTGVCVCFLLFLLTRNVGMGFVGIPGGLELSLPASWYETRWLLPLGFRGAGSDYFPLLPWIFVFLAGSCVGRAMTAADLPPLFTRSRAPFFALCGRNTIFIYILHQPVVYGLLWAFFRFFRR